MSKSGRQSRVELIRIIAILMVVLNHVLQEDLMPLAEVPVRYAANILACLGGTGDVIFFGITAWFLARRPSSVKGSIKRIWLLEREVVFYSLALLFATYVARKGGVVIPGYDSDALHWLGWRSFLPLVSRVWWYPTAYAIFLLAQPGIDLVLERLGKRAHLGVAIASFAVFSIMPTSSQTELGYTPLLFAYQYMLFSYISRHCDPRAIPCGSLLVAGLVVGLVGSFGPIALGASAGAWYLNSPQSFAALAIGSSAVVWAVRGGAWHSPIVNRAASCVFAGYLITCYPVVMAFVSSEIGDLVGLMAGHPAERLIVEVGIAVGLLFGSMMVDLIRQKLFSLTVGRRSGALFERLWSRLMGRFPCLRFMEKPLADGGE